MIPKNIQSNHVIDAIREIDSRSIPRRRRPTGYSLLYEGKKYPPKLVLSIANKFANGEELDSDAFGGGNETNGFLKKLGFEILELPNERYAEVPSLRETSKKTETKAHDERCPKCKETIRKLLEKIYGKVKQNYRFDVGTTPEDFKHTPYYGQLLEIYEALQAYRGFKEFVKTRSLPPCDFFLPNPGNIVEFDESQHFTASRKIALSHYPENLESGFDRKRWMMLCEKIDAMDNDPPFRDEQRAWYDTLRDFLPAIKNLKPTVRLLAHDFSWCSLDSENPSDIRKFENLLRGGSGGFDIKVMEEPDPLLARIVIADEWKGDREEARNVLEEVYKNWPIGKKVKFLMTCGGFVQFDWPRSVSRKSIGDNKYPNNEALEILIKEAKKCAEQVVGSELREKLSEFTDYLTLGIDSQKEKISTTRNFIGKPHVELVFMIDLRNDNYYWTGKSYPTTSQEKGLIRIENLENHFFEFGSIGKILVLGCHDLTIFNPRSQNAKGWREKVNKDFRTISREMSPTIVLQHPHTSDCVMTWAAAWNGLEEKLPSVKIYASAGRYYNSDGERSDLEEVLKKTKRGNSIDFIVRR
jgi:hypothetical protein